MERSSSRETIGLSPSNLLSIMQTLKGKVNVKEGGRWNLDWVWVLFNPTIRRRNKEKTITYNHECSLKRQKMYKHKKNRIEWTGQKLNGKTYIKIKEKRTYEWARGHEKMFKGWRDED